MEHLKILIPTDFSVQAEYAYLMVKKLEEKAQVEIHFLHVMDAPDTVSINGDGDIETCGEIDAGHIRSQKAIADRKLNNLKTLYGEHIRVHLVLGKITDQIIRFAAAEKFDLIVMGTKGAWGLREKLSGTETQMVARHSEVPLLSLMCDRSELVIRNILHVHDYRTKSPNDLSLLKKFIRIFDAKVHLLQIITSENLQEKQHILEQMDAYAKNHGILNYESHMIKDSHIENGVVHFNQMHDMDLICIGTHGRGSFFHSSATEKLINHMYKPIISFHYQSK